MSNRERRLQTPLGLTLRSGLTGVGLVAPIALALSGGLAGIRGLISSLVGLTLVAVFFLVSMVLVERANTVGPALTLPVALTVYGTKIIILGVIVFGTDAVSHLNAPAFSWSVVGATLAWLVAHAWGVWHHRMPYVVIPPAVSPPADVFDADSAADSRVAQASRESTASGGVSPSS